MYAYERPLYTLPERRRPKGDMLHNVPEFEDMAAVDAWIAQHKQPCAEKCRCRCHEKGVYTEAEWEALH